ncbi:DnaJ domain-containing protein [Kickxella alabastrina]|uniref:DnaJ domain-containing protein n=1 Tax=Kickxella alabastrina TaxID=61397 RepID=A0ACC1IQY8_9FUNG|nr:DnaJ domain-containing protein [Kickxella alabastrina]
MSTDTLEVERILQQEATQLARQREVGRVLAQSLLDPFAILQVPRTCTPSDIKAAYRNKSRLIHPDKTAHEHARDAFERLKKAESELMDDERRRSILAMINEARRELTAEWQAEVMSGERGEEDARMEGDAFELAVLEKYKKIMVEIEWRRRQKLKQEMAAEGAATKKEEERAEERRRKRDAEKAWEDSRDDRVSSWRSFQTGSGVSKKGKKKAPVGKKAKLAMAAAAAAKSQTQAQ